MKLKTPINMRPDSNITDFSAEGKLFPEPIASDFGDFVRYAADFYDRHPEIEARIRADQRAAALADKHERARVRNDELLRGEALFGRETIGDGDLVACSLELETGCPRMHPRVVFVFLMMRGRQGGPCRSQAREFALESRSLEAVLFPCIKKLPGNTTVLENINLLSDNTLETIHRLQLAEARDEGLDDFSRIVALRAQKIESLEEPVRAHPEWRRRPVSAKNGSTNWSVCTKPSR